MDKSRLAQKPDCIQNKLYMRVCQWGSHPEMLKPNLGLWDQFLTSSVATYYFCTIFFFSAVRCLLVLLLKITKQSKTNQLVFHTSPTFQAEKKMARAAGLPLGLP